jgi:hypothetical protein
VGNGFELIESFARNRRDAGTPNPCADELWAQMDLNHRPHPYQGCALTELSYGPPDLSACLLRHDEASYRREKASDTRIKNGPRSCGGR